MAKGKRKSRKIMARVAALRADEVNCLRLELLKLMRQRRAERRAQEGKQ